MNRSRSDRRGDCRTFAWRRWPRSSFGADSSSSSNRPFSGRMYPDAMTNQQETAAPSAEEAPRMIPAVGQQAPDLALPDESKQLHRLADQKGRWTVLYFYPEDDTSGCTT